MPGMMETGMTVQFARACSASQPDKECSSTFIRLIYLHARAAKPLAALGRLMQATSRLFLYDLTWACFLWLHGVRRI